MPPRSFTVEIERGDGWEVFSKPHTFVTAERHGKRAATESEAGRSRVRINGIVEFEYHADRTMTLGARKVNV